MKLQYQERPFNIQNKIREAFEHVKSFTNPWRDNGKESYLLCEIDEIKMLKTLVKASPLQSIFRIMDVGAGNFSFGDHIMNSLREMPELDKKTKFEIYSLRAEPVPSEHSVAKTDNCTHYRLGEIEIENLLEQFKAKGLNLTNSIDLAVSSWTLRHLVDPLGTLLQVHNCLKEKQGMFLGDGFFVDIIDNNVTEARFKYYKNLYKILKFFHNNGDSVLVYGNKDQHALDNYILFKKTSETYIPLKYGSLKECHNQSVESQSITSFEEDSGSADKDVVIKPIPQGFYFGSKELFDFIQNNKCQNNWYSNHFGDSTGKDRIEDTYLGHSPSYQCNEEGIIIPATSCDPLLCLGDHII